MLNSELYSKAADMIESGWTQNAFARDEWGHSVGPDEDAATSWCLNGALWLVLYKNTTFNRASNCFASIYYKLIKNLKLSEFAAKWNDDPDRTQKDVVRLLKNAARRADEGSMTYG